MGGAHNLGDDRQARLFSRLAQQFEALGLQALEGVRGGAGLECAAAQELGSCRLDALGHLADLRFRFDGARTRHNGQGAVADFLTAGQLDHGVVGVELAVSLLIWLLHALDALHEVLRGDVVDIDDRRVADEAEHGALRADPGIDLDVIVVRKAVGEMLELFYGAVGL